MIVYDDALISHIDASTFSPARWPGPAHADGLGGGRGKVLFIECDDQRWVLRHYYRGGLARSLSTDRFLWTGLNRTRSFREWALLEHMVGSALPVPRPVAARVVRRGAVYTADLITVRIEDVTTLSERLSRAAQRPEIWMAIGRLIARFHAAGIDHADLNAHNIQIGADDQLYLLDFDRGRAMSAPGDWMQKNLNRLYRSFTKLVGQGAIQFSAVDWGYLRDGYRTALADLSHREA